MEIKPQCLNSAQDITASYLPIREHSISLPPSAKVGTDRAPGNPGVGVQVSSHPRYQTKGSRNLNPPFSGLPKPVCRSSAANASKAGVQLQREQGPAAPLQACWRPPLLPAQPHKRPRSPGGFHTPQSLCPVLGGLENGAGHCLAASDTAAAELSY